MMNIDGNNYYGTHGPLLVPSPEVQIVRAKFWGVNGMSEIRGGRGGRELICHSWVHNEFLTNDALTAYLRTLNNTAGQINGTLTRTYPDGGPPRVFKNV